MGQEASYCALPGLFSLSLLRSGGNLLHPLHHFQPMVSPIQHQARSAGQQAAFSWYLHPREIQIDVFQSISGLARLAGQVGLLQQFVLIITLFPVPFHMFQLF